MLFQLGGNLDFTEFLYKRFITSTTEGTFGGNLENFQFEIDEKDKSFYTLNLYFQKRCRSGCRFTLVQRRWLYPPLLHLRAVEHLLRGKPLQADARSQRPEEIG